MSGREWKPGDVALVTFDNASAVDQRAGKSDVVTKIALRSANWWGMSRGEGLADEQGDCIVAIRPLVVIDPEDREQVERLTVTLADHLTPTGEFGPDGYTVEEVRDALREFANPKPPKPDEPKGVGAVVEDSHGEQYVQIEPKGGVWRCTRTARAFGWDSIPVVRVLSEGVAPDA